MLLMSQLGDRLKCRMLVVRKSVNSFTQVSLSQWILLLGFPVTYEVELKFQLDNSELVEASLRKLGAMELPVVTHVDRYFNHPSRNFRETDEAFRIRSVGESNYVTYKGAVIGTVAKTRHEIEIGFANGEGSAKRFVEMVTLLGFRFVRDVRKTRRSMSLDWNGHHFDLALDEVSPLGRFLEIELCVEDNQREASESAVWSLARALGLSDPERRSYLDLLLESDGTIDPE